MADMWFWRRFTLWFVALAVTPIVVVVLIRLVLWAVTGDGSWIGK